MAIHEPHIRNFAGLISLCLLLACCGSATRTADNSSRVGNDHSSDKSVNSQEIRDNRPPILEIMKELTGSVPISGESLYFRLYDDGIVEFDYLMREQDNAAKPRVKYSVHRTKPTQLPAQELARFRSSLEQLAQTEKIRDEYKPAGLTLDVITKLRIRVNMNGVTRTILINDADYDITSSKYENNFPKPLTNLIKQIRLLRAERDAL